MNDLMLWKQMKEGDSLAFKEIYNLHILHLTNYAKKLSSDLELIEDTIHDLFVSIWQKRESIGETDCIIKYLCVSLRRELIRRMEKASHFSAIESVENQDINFSVSVEDLIINDETDQQHRQMLKNGMDALSSRQREALYLKYYEEMSYEQICEVMNINYQSVRNLISKSIIELRKFIGLVLLYFFTFS
jgi:RNA polymerase sigma factor (sigma-70 family)